MSPLVFLSVGLIMIFLEFFIPGAVMGITGLVFVIVSVVLYAMEATSPIYVALYFLLVVLLLIGLVKFALWRIRSSGKENTFFLEKDQQGYTSEKYDVSVVGKEGIATTDLRPAGRIKIEGTTYQAISQGGFIPIGTTIIVTGGEGPTLIVKTAKKDP